MTAGVQRQYTGTAGRIENAQVAVYLAYAAARGYAFIDRALYLPRSWTDDPGRCQDAGVPGDVEFATKPVLALMMITRAVTAGAPARWAAGDEVYGNDPKLRAGIAGHGLGFVLAVAKDHRIFTAAGTRRAIDLAVCLPAGAWQQMSAGAGAKGPRLYDWALIETSDPALPADSQGANWLLIRRPIRTAPATKTDYAFYRAHAPGPVPLHALVSVAGTRWKVEEGFAGGKELTGLDQHQVRSWTSWTRWTILAMLAHAFLSAMTTTQPGPGPGDVHHDEAGHELIPLTRNEIRRLFTGLLCRPQPVDADLLAVAAEASRPLAEASNDPRALATYIAGIAVGEKDRLAAGGQAARARMELLRGFGEPSADQHTGSSSLRTVAHLLNTTAERHRQRGQ